MIGFQLWSALALAVALPFLSQCTVAPGPGEKETSVARPTPETGILVRTSRNLAEGRPTGHSSFLLLEGAKEALDWRLALIDSAQSSIDIQVYLWRDGASAGLLFDRLLEAADRGVRVRMLVDDFLYSSDEKLVSAICRHQPNLDIRIFNPTRLRGNPIGASAEILLNYQHLNRRMHNKTWTVDGSFTIVGGRNVSDSYFGLDPKYNFIDLDVMASGPVVKEVSEGFDAYWNASQAYPAALFSKRGSPEEVTELRQTLSEYLESESSELLQSYPIEPMDWTRELAGLKSRMASGRANFVQDHPEADQDDRKVVTSLDQMVAPKEEIIFVSAYLIPSRETLAQIESSTRSGVEIRFLAPTLAANNQPLVHGHYRKKRHEILSRGGQLFELKSEPGAKVRSLADVAPARSKVVCLHIKAVTGERRRCFIGSLNFDPRALEINTECGLLIDSPQLTAELHDLLEEILADACWELQLNERGDVTWNTDGATRIKEPP
ncbi:MAG: phospholipase D family protein, partial [Haloferula sp.]